MVCTEVANMLAPPNCDKVAMVEETAALVLEVVSAKSASGMDAVALGLTLSQRKFVPVPIKVEGKGSSRSARPRPATVVVL